MLRESVTRVEVEEVGVPCAEELGELAVPEEDKLAFCAGDEEPVLGSFLLFELLLESLLRESCSC